MLHCIEIGESIEKNERKKYVEEVQKMVGGSGSSPIVARSCFTPICNVSSTSMCVWEREGKSTCQTHRMPEVHRFMQQFAKWSKFAISLMQQRQPRHIAKHSHSHGSNQFHFFFALLFRVFTRTWACANRRVELVRVYNESPFIGNRRRRARTRQKVKMLLRRRRWTNICRLSPLVQVLHREPDFQSHLNIGCESPAALRLIPPDSIVKCRSQNPIATQNLTFASCFFSAIFSSSLKCRMRNMLRGTYNGNGDGVNSQRSLYKNGFTAYMRVRVRAHTQEIGGGYFVCVFFYCFFFHFFSHSRRSTWELCGKNASDDEEKQKYVRANAAAVVVCLFSFQFFLFRFVLHVTFHGGNSRRLAKDRLIWLIATAFVRWVFAQREWQRWPIEIMQYVARANRSG